MISREPSSSNASHHLLPEAEEFPHATPSFRCRLVEDVVYWKVSFLSG
jgi:hypothetical protein